MARCGACGQPKVQAGNTPSNALLVGEPDGMLRRVLAVEDGPLPAGAVAYVTGSGVADLLASGVLQLL